MEDHLIRKFGDTFYKAIFKAVVQKYSGVSAKTLAVNAVDPFEVTRILAFDDATTKRLAKIDIYNSKLGFHVKGEATHNNYYPKHGGVGYQISKLMCRLDQMGVEFQPSAIITKIQERKVRYTKLLQRADQLK